MNKLIKNYCVGNEKCILKVNNKFFGYDGHPQHPEASFNDACKAFIFKNQKEALDVTSWVKGTEFEILPYTDLTNKDNKDDSFKLTWNKFNSDYVSRSDNFVFKLKLESALIGVKNYGETYNLYIRGINEVKFEKTEYSFFMKSYVELVRELKIWNDIDEIKTRTEEILEVNHYIS